MTAPPIPSEQVGRAAWPLGAFLGRSRSTAHRPPLLTSLARFVTSGALSVTTDFVTLWVLHSLLHVALAVSTLIGYGLSLVVNYTLNHNWVFEAGGDHRHRLFRYAILVAFNVGSNLLFVLGLTAVGVFYLLAKVIAIAVNAGVNFLGFRHWVFR